MRLLQSTFPRVRRLLPTGDGLVTVTFASLVVGLEFAGRVATSDLQDGLAGLLLAAAVALVVVRHRRRPLAWVAWLSRRVSGVGDWLDRVRYDHGIDLRGTPPLPRRLPPVVWAVLTVLTMWAGLAAGAWFVFPDGWRDVGTRSSYVLYLVVMLTVWAGLVACTFVGIYVPVLLFDHILKSVDTSAERRRYELALVAAYGIFIALVAWLVPTIIVLGLCGLVGMVAAVAVVRAGQDEPAILWRAGAGRTIYAVPFRRLVAGGVGLLAFLVFDLLLTACGGRLLTHPDPADPMPVTTLLGTTAAWMIPGIVVVAGVRLTANRRTDPARRTPLTVHLTSKLEADAIARAVAVLRGWGWRVRPAKVPRDPDDVGIELVAPAQSEATEYEPRWPLKVALTDLTPTGVQDRLVRRDEIRLRRHLTRGVETLFKKARAERGPKGGGYWFAPHWWFITGLDREDPHRGRTDRPTPPRPVGPPFQRTFTPRTRQYAHQLLRGVEIDMIFIEDGVSHRSVVRVIRALFQLYDRHAGAKKAEDHLFRGMPKVRVMVHEYAPGKPFEATGYPEPQFDDLSRARVLHVFRDNGGDEADVEVPFDFSWEPSPMLGVG